MVKRNVLLAAIACSVMIAGCGEPDSGKNASNAAGDGSSKAIDNTVTPDKPTTSDAPAKSTTTAGDDGAAPAGPAAFDFKPNDEAVNQQAPDQFKVKFETTKGDFTMRITRDWSPNGADRFYNLVNNGYFTDVSFFRVVPGFVAQFGIHGNPDVADDWNEATIKDDPVKKSNTRGTITFAKTGAPNSRSTQFFINFGDNSRLDGMGFSPFGQVIEGMTVVDSLYDDYGEQLTQLQGTIKMKGNDYLRKNYPKLDYIKTATIVE